MLTATIAAFALQIPQATATLEVPKSVKVNTPVKAAVTIVVPEGNHAYVPVKDTMMLPVTITLPDGAKYKLVKADFPKGESKTYPGLGDEASMVYEGMVKIPVQLAMAKGTKNKFAFKLNVRVQMCSNEGGTCFPPQTITLTGAVKVTAK